MKHHKIVLSEKQLEAHMAQVKQLFSKKPVSIKKAEKAITKLAIINACAYKGTEKGPLTWGGSSLK